MICTIFILLLHPGVMIIKPSLNLNVIELKSSSITKYCKNTRSRWKQVGLFDFSAVKICHLYKLLILTKFSPFLPNVSNKIMYMNSPVSMNPLMGVFMGGCTPPFTNFFDLWLRSSRCGKDFLPVLSKLSQASMVKIFHFSDEWKVVSVAPQRGGCTPPP